MSRGAMLAWSSAAMMAAAGSAGIEAVLAMATRPDSSSWTIRSVKVPPTSTATRYRLIRRILSCVSSCSSAATSAQCCSVQRAPQRTHIRASVSGLAARPLRDHALRAGRAGAGVALPEIGGDLRKRRPAHPLVPGDVVDEALQHEQHLGPPGDIGVDGDGEDRVVVLAVDPVELVAPDLLQVPRVDEAVAVGRLLDEHHRRQIVDIPVGPDLDQIRLLSAHERLHPRLGRLRVVDLRPGVADPSVEGMEVVVHAAVVVGDAVLEQQRHGGCAQLPPGSDVPGGTLAGEALDEGDAL